MGTDMASPAVRTACDDQVVGTVRRSALLGIPASCLLAAILGSAVGSVLLIEFVALVALTDIACFVVLSWYGRARARGEVVDRFWIGPCSAALVSLAWTSLAWFGQPDAAHIELRVVYLLFIAGISATYVVGTAARRRYFWSSQVPLVVPVAAIYLSSADHVSRLLGVAIVMYLAVMAVLHRDVHELVLSELTLREQNDAANARLAYEATHDSLTGLANRTAFMTRLERAVEGTAPRALVAVLYIDLDRFKVVNDSLGHAAGDDLLREVAVRMEALFADVEGLVARFGGDEFTVVLENVASESAALDAAKRVSEVLEDPVPIAGRRVSVSASVGVATTRTTDDSQVLLAHADAAQYRAKKSGRRRVEMFNVRLRQSLERRLDEEQQVRRALDHGDIVAWYQPIIDLETMAIVAVEALARWPHPTRGLLDASEFVPLIAETGLVVALDDHIVGQATEAAARLGSAPHGAGIRVWCNASVHHFARTTPTRRLVQLLERAGCDPHMIGFEITETALLVDTETAAREISAARDLGVRTALDDFGVGNSSLTVLHSLPIDEVKIDRSFVREMTRDATAAGIVSSVLALADRLGIQAVAEGVEYPEQVRLLRASGCRYAQGHLWGKAMPLEQVLARLGANAARPAPVASPLVDQR